MHIFHQFEHLQLAYMSDIIIHSSITDHWLIIIIITIFINIINIISFTILT